jgi:membrane fusion protein, copper/silver efflux system
MDMELVPVYEDDAGDDGSISINPRVVQNIGVRLATAEAVNFARRVDTVGTVMFDERRIEVVESRAAGWVERLHVRAENDPVRRGQLLAEVYAPDLFAAQGEFVLALKNAGSGEDLLVRAARARLSFLGLSQAQIAELENTREPRRRIAFYSPISGIVAKLGVRQGMQVGPGIKLFEIVDLSTVWITAEIVENQAAWITEGKKVEARVAALPGKVFEGKVEYVYPELMRETRTLMARVSVKNPGLQLKPGMFAELALYAGEKNNTLAVPTEAVIQTGTRTVVIVAEGEGKFRPVAVLTGLESEGKTEILKGLEQGQQVVASGQFLIDSEASLRTALERLKEPEPQVQPLQKEGTLRYKSNPTVTGK